MDHYGPLRDEDWEALVQLKTLCETERWATEEYYPELEDDFAAPLPSNRGPDQWTFFSTDRTAFEGKWVHRTARRTKQRLNKANEETPTEIPEHEPHKGAWFEFSDRSEQLADLLLESAQLSGLPAPLNVRDPEAWLKKTGGWVLNIRDLDDDGNRGVEFAASTRDLDDRLVERVLIRGEVTRKGIDVSLFLEGSCQRSFSALDGDAGLLHFMTLSFGDVRWRKIAMGPPPLPVRAWHLAYC